MVSVTAPLPASLDGMVANVRQLCPHERIEFFEKLLRDCSFMEIRFIASLVENILSANYGCLGSVEDELPHLLCNSEKLIAFGDKLHLDDQRRQLIVILCLLKSRERLEVTKVIAEIFQKVPEAVRKMNATSSLTVLAAHEILLLFSLAMCHPAFEFSQKYNIYTALQSVVDLLQPALGDGDKESCILLKSAQNGLAGNSTSSVSADKADLSKPFKISQDEDIAFIQVDIPVTSAVGNSNQQSLKSVTVKTENLVNYYAKECVQHPSNPKTDPNNVLLKSKEGPRESVLQSALNSIVSDGGIHRLLEMFPQNAKDLLAVERSQQIGSRQENAEISSTPDSDFPLNDNHSPNSTGAHSGSSSSSRVFDKNLAKPESSRNISSAADSTSSGTASSGIETTMEHRKLPSAPPSLNTEESPTSRSSSVDWNNVQAKTGLNKNKADDMTSHSSTEGSTSSKHSGANLNVGAESNINESAISTSKTPRSHYEYSQQVHQVDQKAFAMNPYIQACPAAFGMHVPPPQTGNLMWSPHMMEHVSHPPPHPSLLMQLQPVVSDHGAISSQRSISSNSRNPGQGTPVQSSTPTPTAAKQESCDSSEKVIGSIASGEEQGSSESETITETKREETSSLSEPGEKEGPSVHPTISTSVPSTSSIQTSSRSIAPFVQQQHPIHLTSAGPIGVPNLFAGPVQFMPLGQHPQIPANQSSNTGSRRGSVASEPGDPGHFSAYYICPPMLPSANAHAHLHPPANSSTASSSAFVGPRNSPALALPPFANLSHIPHMFHPSGTNSGASSRKSSVSAPSNAITVPLTPAQLFSIPPPPLPMSVQKSGPNSTSSTTTNPSSSHPLPSTSVQYPVPMTNRELHHAFSFPAFVNPQSSEPFSPPSQPRAPSPSGSTTAAPVSATAVGSSNANNGSSSNNNFKQHNDNMRHHGPFSGQHGGTVAGARRPVTGFANIHYHQRINSQHANANHMHQSQSMNNIPVRPQPTVVRGNTVHCFRCGEPGHLQNQCNNNGRRRTPYSGRDFSINPAPLSVSSSSENQDPRVSMASVQRNQSQTQITAVTEGSKIQQQQTSIAKPITKSVRTDNADCVLPSVVVTDDSPNPVAIAQ